MVPLRLGLQARAINIQLPACTAPRIVRALPHEASRPPVQQLSIDFHPRGKSFQIDGEFAGARGVNLGEPHIIKKNEGEAGDGVFGLEVSVLLEELVKGIAAVEV